MINLELNLQQAAVIRQALFVEQRGYTIDPTCTPARIVDVRSVIATLDKMIDDQLQSETTGK
jgi:hypothetical protein